eukprot:9888615-Lingulodinium_polyedra.AAC.1
MARRLVKRCKRWVPTVVIQTGKATGRPLAVLQAQEDEYRRLWHARPGAKPRPTGRAVPFERVEAPTPSAIR